MQNKENTEIKIALIEQRVTSLEDYQKRIETKLDKILDKLDKEFVPRHEYEEDIRVIRDELKGYKSSQLWQKIIISIATAIFVSIVTYEITKK